jgi:HK97 family phage prohead protease
VTLASLPTAPPLEPEVYVRTRTAEYEIDRGRGIVEALIVPWMKPAPITQVVHRSNGPAIVDYVEQFAPGSLDRAKAAPRRVGLAFTHSEAMPDRMGYGLELRDSAEGAVMQFQLYRDTLDRSVELLTTSHDGMSVSFRAVAPRYGTERDGETVTRTAVHLVYVAATDDPAYTDTRVLAIRERQERLELERVENERHAAQYVDALLLLRSVGRELTPAQTAYLAEHGHPAPAT